MVLQQAAGRRISIPARAKLSQVPFPSSQVFNGMELNDIIAGGVSQLLALLVVLSVSGLHKLLVKKKLAKQSTVRKVLHICTGFVYACTWPLYSDHWSARYLASLTPMVYVVRLIPAWLGWTRNDSILSIMTRHNTRQEAGRGPMAYALVHVALTIVFWRDSAAGLVGIGVLCAGDGLAEIVGAPYGKHKWWMNKRKSVEGSTAMLSAGFLGALGLARLFCYLGYFTCSDDDTWVILVATAAATLTETLPLDAYLPDNWGVAITAAGVTWALGK